MIMRTFVVPIVLCLTLALAAKVDSSALATTVETASTKFAMQCTSNSCSDMYQTCPPGRTSTPCYYQPPPSCNCSPPSGYSFPIGVTPVTCTNSLIPSLRIVFNVHVAASGGIGLDKQPEVQALPAVPAELPATVATESTKFAMQCTSNSCSDIHQTCPRGQTSTPCYYQPPPACNCSPPSGYSFPIGITPVTCTNSLIPSIRIGFKVYVAAWGGVGLDKEPAVQALSEHA